jgi:hypothetical protein
MVMFHTADCAETVSFERINLLKDLYTAGGPMTDIVTGAEVIELTLDVRVNAPFVCKPFPIAITETVYKQFVLEGIVPELRLIVVAVLPTPVQPGVATMVPGTIESPLGSTSVKNALVMAYGNAFTTEIVSDVTSPTRTDSAPNVFDSGLATTSRVAWLDEATGRLLDTRKLGLV